jgi:hypothetical protein
MCCVLSCACGGVTANVHVMRHMAAERWQNVIRTVRSFRDAIAPLFSWVSGTPLCGFDSRAQFAAESA